VKIEAGYNVTFNNAQEVPIVLMLSVHPSRQHDLPTDHRIEFSPCVKPRYYLDGFGNICTRSGMANNFGTLTRRSAVPAKSGASGKCRDATRKSCRRGRKQDQTLADGKDEKAAGHNIISCPKVFCGEHCCGHHKSRAVDRPQYTLHILSRYHGPSPAEATRAPQCRRLHDLEGNGHDGILDASRRTALTHSAITLTYWSSGGSRAENPA
jgi:hypothetical protein